MMFFLFELFLAISFAYFLALLASFFNVVIFRTVREESFIRGRSKCEHCHRQIAWYDNLPIFSFLKLKGRCRHCQQVIAREHFVVELLAFILGLVFSLVLIDAGDLLSVTFLWSTMLYFLFFFVLIFAFLADFQYLIVPDFLVGLLLILAIVIQVVTQAAWDLALLAVLFASGFLGALYFVAKKILKKEALGLGDIKLIVPLALVLSWPKILVSLFLSFIMGGFFAMLILIMGKKKLGQALPFAPFLIVAALLSFYFGEAIWQWYFALLI